MTQKQLLNNRILLGQRLAEIREERGLTQQDVAEASGVMRPNVARIERGKYNVTLDVLSKVVGALDCEISISPK